MLIQCPECGKEISDKAENCPNCGCPASVWTKAEPKAEPEESAEEGSFPLRVAIVGDYRVLIACRNCGNEFLVVPEAVEKDGDKYTFRQKVCCPQCQACVEEGSWYRENAFYSEAPAKKEAYPTEAPRTIQNADADRSKRKCAKCGGDMTVQVVTEQENAGCFTILLYIILALTVVGLLIVIPLALRKKTETVTYAVCQKCGNKIELSRT